MSTMSITTTPSTQATCKANHVELTVPTQPRFARTVRMAAASLAVAYRASVDEVEDIRMMAEESFILACSVGTRCCSFDFSATEQEMTIHIALDRVDTEPVIEQDTPAALGDEVSIDMGETPEGTLELAQMLLAALCDECSFDMEAKHLVMKKQIGSADGE